MDPDAAPIPAPIAAGRDGYEDLAAECDTVAVVLQTIGSLVVPSDIEFGMELVEDVPLEDTVVLEIDIGVSMAVAGTNGVPKVKFVKLWEQQEPWVTGVPFSRISMPQHHVLA